MPNLILAIDPGPVESAYVVLNADTYEIVDANKVGNHSMLLDTILRGYTKDVVIEMVQSFGMPVGAEIFETCFWIGRFWERAIETGQTCTKIYRNDVKQHLCHSIKGVNDSVIRQALIDRFGKPGRKKDRGHTYGLSKDTWQAFALGVTYIDSLKVQACQTK